MGSSASKAEAKAAAASEVDAHRVAVAKFEADVPCTRTCAAPTMDTCSTTTFGGTLKTFLVQGNAIDIAIGLMLAAAFAKIVTSVINDVLTPLILCPVGDFTLRDKFFVCRKRRYTNIKALEDAGIVAVGLYPDLDAAEAAGVDVFIHVESLDEAQALGLNTVNWGNFLQILFNFVVIVVILVALVYAIGKARCAFKAAAAKKK